MKNFKTFYKPQAASCLKEVVQSPTREKLLTLVEQKFYYGDLQEYTDICFPSSSRIQFSGV